MLPLRLAVGLCVQAGPALIVCRGAETEHAPLDQRQLRERCIQILQRELHENSSWLKVHAAEGLLEHNLSDGIPSLFKAELTNAAPPYHIGVLRVLAVADRAEKQSHVSQIRTTFADLDSPARVHATETLAKLGAGTLLDIPHIEEWLRDASARDAAYLYWLLATAPIAERRESVLDQLAGLLRSPDETARLRAAYALARIKPLTPSSLAALDEQLAQEPPQSAALPYIIAACAQHTPPSSPQYKNLISILLQFASSGTTAQKYEILPLLGRLQVREALPIMVQQLGATESDARIGAANGLLHLLP